MAFARYAWIRGYNAGPTIIDRISWEPAPGVAGKGLTTDANLADLCSFGVGKRLTAARIGKLGLARDS